MPVGSHDATLTVFLTIIMHLGSVLQPQS